MSRPVTVWLLIGLVLAAFVLAGRRDQCSCQLPSCSLAWAVESPSPPEESPAKDQAQMGATQPSEDPSVSQDSNTTGSASEAASPGEQPGQPSAETPPAEQPAAAPAEPQPQPESRPASPPAEPASPPQEETSPPPIPEPEKPSSPPADQAQAVSPAPAEEATEAKPQPQEPAPEQPKEPKEDPTPPPAEPPIPNLAEIIAKLRQQEPGKYRPVAEICQVKTYRVETLHGFGLVVDLTDLARSLGASGRTSQPAISSLGSPLKPGISSPVAESSRRGESPSSADLKAALALLDRTAVDELLEAIPESLWERRAITLVTVTVNIPPEGAHQGDRLDCQVRSFEPKSLSGGFLLPTKLYPPGPRDKAPVGIAAGPVVSESTLRTGGDRVVGGCLVQQDIQEEFVRDGKIRLLLKPEHASFLVAQDIADRINVEVGLFAGKPIARALSSSVIEVEVPPGFEDNPVGFVTQVLRLPSSVPVEQSATVPFRSTIPEGRR